MLSVVRSAALASALVVVFLSGPAGGEAPLAAAAHGRRLPQAGTALSSNGTTQDAALPYGLPTCLGDGPPFFNWCNVGCRSKFYKVVGTGESMTASTCGGADFDTKLIVREGSAATPCSELTCAGAYLPRLHLCWLAPY
jgi:hypothetical protein